MCNENEIHHRFDKFVIVNPGNYVITCIRKEGCGDLKGNNSESTFVSRFLGFPSNRRLGYLPLFRREWSEYPPEYKPEGVVSSVYALAERLFLSVSNEIPKHQENKPFSEIDTPIGPYDQHVVRIDYMESGQVRVVLPAFFSSHLENPNDGYCEDIIVRYSVVINQP